MKKFFVICFVLLGIVGIALFLYEMNKVFLILTAISFIFAYSIYTSKNNNAIEINNNSVTLNGKKVYKGPITEVKITNGSVIINGKTIN